MALSAQGAEQGRRKALTRAHVIERIQRWHALYGEPPTSADWNPSVARWRAQEWRIERYRAGDPETADAWPSLNASKRLFAGSFDAAVREAGFVPHRSGPRRAAGVARPAVAQRPPPGAPLDADAALAAAADRVREAERRASEVHAAASKAVALALEAETRAEAAERRAAAAERRLAGARTRPLDAGGPAGPSVLAGALRALARARVTNDRATLSAALTEVATAAIRWRDRL